MSIMQQQTSTFTSLLVQMNGDINGANTEIQQFNSNLATIAATVDDSERDILQFRNETEAQLVRMQSLAEGTFTQFLNISKELQSQFKQSVNEAMHMMQQLQALNASAIERMESTRDQFVHVTVPAATETLQSLISSLSAHDLRVEVVSSPFTVDTISASSGTSGTVPGSSFALSVQSGDIVQLRITARGAYEDGGGAFNLIPISNGCTQIGAAPAGWLTTTNAEFGMDTHQLCVVNSGITTLMGEVQFDFDSSTAVGHIVYGMIFAHVIGHA